MIGAHSWKVKACLGGNCGLWSDTLSFSYTETPTGPRFTDNGDGTVTDNSTKLMWTETANLYDGWESWTGADDFCNFQPSLAIATGVYHQFMN